MKLLRPKPVLLVYLLILLGLGVASMIALAAVSWRVVFDSGVHPLDAALDDQGNLTIHSRKEGFVSIISIKGTKAELINWTDRPIQTWPRDECQVNGRVPKQADYVFALVTQSVLSERVIHELNRELVSYREPDSMKGDLLHLLISMQVQKQGHRWVLIKQVR